jgi:hypothetical protein
LPIGTPLRRLAGTRLSRLLQQREQFVERGDPHEARAASETIQVDRAEAHGGGPLERLWVRVDNDRGTWFDARVHDDPLEIAARGLVAPSRSTP